MEWCEQVEAECSESAARSHFAGVQAERLNSCESTVLSPALDRACAELSESNWLIGSSAQVTPTLWLGRVVESDVISVFHTPSVCAHRWPTAKRPNRVRACHLTSPTISQNHFDLRFIMSS